MRHLYLCLGLTIAALCISAVNSCVVCNHLLTAPKKIREGVEETAVLNLHGVSGVVNVVATVKLDGVRNFPILNADATKPIVIKIRYEKPPGAPKTNRKQYVDLIVSATQGATKKYDGQLKMLLVQESGYIYVQTDRPIYKPEERVEIRVTALNQKQGPELARDVEVVIRIPEEMGSVGVEKQKKRMRGKMIETHYQLPEFPVFGVWTISARFLDEKYPKWETTTFEVKEYVLPTFNVRISLDKPFVLVKKEMADEYIEGTITSEYSYGKKVSGSYFLMAKLTRPGIDIPVSFYQFPEKISQYASIKGEKKFKIKATNVFKVMGKDETFDDLVEEGATLTVEAAVTGRADGVIETSATKPIPFVRSPYVLGIERMSKYYTPGIAFEIKVDVLDSISFKPLKGVDVVLKGPITCGSLKCPENACCEEGKCIPCKVIVEESDENGHVSFKVNMEFNAVTRTFMISTRNFAVPDPNEAVKTFILQPYNSPSGSVLQLSAVEKIAYVGDQNFGIDVWYKEAPKELRYMIMSRGSIITTGVEKPKPKTINTNVMIKITADMVPSFKIFFHFINEKKREVVSNSLWVEVEDECKYEIEVTVPNQLAPGQHSLVQYKGPPNAVIGMAAVDRAAYFLYDKGRLTRAKAFDSLNEYDEGCVREGGKNAQHVFEEAGLQLVGGGWVAKADIRRDCEETKSRKKRGVNANLEELNEKLTKEAKLRKCEFDGALESLADTTCDERAEQVENQHGYECAKIFHDSCKINYRNRKVGRAGKSGENAGGFQAINSKERSNFEESMLWTTEKLGPDGKHSEPIVARDSITTFEFDTISLHPTEGFCVAPTQNMTIFKDIFIKLNLPYSLKRMEQAFIRATVFNYSPNNKKIRIQAKMGKDICSFFPEEQFADVLTLDVAANSAESTSFTIIPLRVPSNEKVEIQVKAFDEDLTIEYDHITKSVLVQPEGEIKHDVKGTHTIDLKHKPKNYVDRFPIKFRFPARYTKGTRQCWIYPYSNFMGPIIEFDPVTKQPKNDIHNIIRMPGGCGEQTMLSMGPNAMAHKYLKSVGKMLPGSEREKGSVDKMKKGFANELKYRTAGNPIVWSVFPRHAPSVWLNAYVNKIFAQVKQFYVEMDVGPICASVDWLTKQQDPDGGFKTGGRVIHQEMHGAVGSKLSLSAYVMMSLVESHSLCPGLVKAVENSIMRVNEYLIGMENDRQMEQPYALSLVCYALTVANPNDPFAEKMRKKLLSKIQYSADNRLAFWKGAPLKTVQGTGTHAYWYIRKPLAVDIEATGYALLSILLAQSTKKDISQDVFDVTRKIVLWIIEQRDDKGGFTTTQDTVVGLQALAEYMIWSNKVEPESKKVKIDITISSPNGSEWFANPKRIHLDESNENTTSPIALPPSVVGKGELNIQARGEGEGTISYRCVYRTLVEEDACHFDLVVSLKSKPGSDGAVMLLEIELSKPKGEKSGQSIAEINLISGYEPMENTLQNLNKDNVVDGTIERYEIVKQKVIIYLSEITERSTKIAFYISRTVLVENPEPATVKVYDYYEPSVQCTKFYNVPKGSVKLTTTCKDRNGVGTEDLCKCAEGGCLTCRTREHQLRKTVCLPGINEKCVICDEDEVSNCFNMSKAACKGNYVYEIKVIDDGKTDPSGVFIHFQAEIYQVYKRGPDILARSGESRTFTTRKDCYEKCKDDAVLVDKDGNSMPFIAKDRTMLAIGKTVEEYVDNAGENVIDYGMGDDMYLERIYPADKCKRAKKKLEDKCTKKKLSDNAKADCEKQTAIFQSCYNLRQLRRMLAKGCDE